MGFKVEGLGFGIQGGLSITGLVSRFWDKGGLELKNTGMMQGKEGGMVRSGILADTAS